MAKNTHQPEGAKQHPGLTCPECSFLIHMSIPALLSGETIICPSCGLKLTVDQDKSRTCLDELRKVNEAIEKARRAQLGQSE